MPVLTENWQASGFGLYIHWPFCQAKCPYCDFNSHVAAEIDQSRWKHAYLSEIRRVGAETGGRLLSTIFFGGGTPSLMSADLVASILECARDTWPAANDLEVTLEANPTSVEADRFLGYRDAGVTRVSLGMQALSDRDLKALGRLHTVAEAEAAFGIAANTFDRVSLDLIYARQNQSLRAWRDELGRALRIAAGHLSLYQLTIEPGTAFGDRRARGGLAGLPDDDLGADLYHLTQELCDAAGLPAYEISNHARTQHECRHNLIYWKSGDYAGIGPGAHGRLTFGNKRYATDTPLAPADWLSAVEKSGTGENPRTELSADDRAAEYLLMGMRLATGISIGQVQALSCKELNYNKIRCLEDIGVVKTSGDTLRATRRGRPVLNAVLRELLV